MEIEQELERKKKQWDFFKKKTKKTIIQQNIERSGNKTTCRTE